MSKRLSEEAIKSGEIFTDFLLNLSQFCIALKKGWLIKRSQQTSFIKILNFKRRWYELNRTTLSFHEGFDASRLTEVGRISLTKIVVIEKVVLRESNEKAYTFQIEYVENGINKWTNNRSLLKNHFLYLIAKTAEERDEWISLIRNLVRKNVQIAEKYHPGFWNSGAWFCCGHTYKGINSGCCQVTWYQSINDRVGNLKPQTDKGNEKCHLKLLTQF